MLISFLIAISLNFDTFSVAVVQGAEMSKPALKDSLRVGLFFGFGQAMLALIGSFLGLGFKLAISNIDHWIAFILLGIVGIRLINESKNMSGCEKKLGFLNYKSLFLLVIATSIDALVVGITFAFLKVSIATNVLMIGIITFIVSFVGFYAGQPLRAVCKSKVKVVGGLILITIGIKILLEHIFFEG